MVGAYFIEFIIIKLFFGLFWELSRAWPALQYLVAHAFGSPKTWTKRSLREAFMSFPEWLFGWVYPSLLSVVIICFTYSVITPMVSVFSLAFFLAAEVVYKNQALYVYVNATEGGGYHWNAVVRRLMCGLIFSHVLLAGYLAVNKCNTQWTVMVFLIIADILFMLYCYYAYEQNIWTVGLETAAEKDRFGAHASSSMRSPLQPPLLASRSLGYWMQTRCQNLIGACTSNLL